MLISNQDNELLRQCSKDDASYHKLLNLFTQKQVKEQLEHKGDVQQQVEEQRYRQMFDSHQVMKLLIDPDTGGIVDANPAAVAFYGYSIEQFQSMRIQDINILSSEEVHVEMQLAHAQKRTFFEFQHRLASGKVRDVDVYSSPVDMPEGRLLYSIIVDVTNKREAELRYHSLFEQSTDAVFILDLKGNHIDVNQRAADMFGYEIGEIIQLSYREIVTPTEHHKSEEIREQLQAGIRIPPYERTVRHKDGSLFSAEINVEIIRNHAGIPLHTQSIIRDISERKRAEAALLASREAMRRLIEQIPVGIQVFDTKGLCTDVNQAHLDIFGVTREDLVNQYNIFEDPLASETLTQQAAKRALGGELVKLGDLTFDFAQGDPRYTLTSQSRRTLTVTMVPILSENNQVINFMGVNVDITERKLAEEALRKATTSLEEAVRAGNVGLWDWDIKTDKVLFSAEWKRQIGYEEHEFGDDLEDFRSRIHHDDVEKAFKLNDTMFEDFKNRSHTANKGEMTTKTHQNESLEFRLRHKDGSYRWILSQGSIVQDESGRPIRMVGTHIDVTERKQAQEHEFDLALEKERLQLVMTFIQNSAHEFRTPLSTINTNVYLMSQQDDPEYRAQKMEQLLNQVQRITNLVDMLLLMVKLESLDRIRRNPINIGAMIKSVCQKVSQDYGDKPKLHYEILADLPTVLGEMDYLIDGFKQILDNAYRFTPDDGVITITSGVINNTIWLDVRDTGIGIPENSLPHIFNTFWRQDQVHSTPGFGLGLSIAKKAIELHDGKITVESEVGQGTCIRIMLPILQN